MAFSEPVSVSTVYSDFGERIKRFSSVDELEGHRCGRPFESYALHYRDTGGHVEERRISLDPNKCGGHAFRHSVDGWGLIHIQITEKEHNLCECRIAVNSPKRTQAWASTYPEYEAPNQWNWEATEKHARKLIRHLKKIAAQQIAPGDAPQAVRS